MPLIAFVNESDEVIGAGSKAEAWRFGIYHRIARVFLFNERGETLITKRSEALISSPGKWNEAASGHVDEGESYEEAALRELEEEVGVAGVELTPIAKVKHSEVDEPDKLKNRFHMIYIASYGGPVWANPEEVSETQWIGPGKLSAWVERAPLEFTEGFRLAFKTLKEFDSLNLK